jgi:hypothetical protein
LVEALSKEERLRILRTIEEDLEFRYAIAGAVGLAEVLKRLDSIEARIEEHSRVLQEHSKVLQEHSRILQEHSKRLEELSLRIEGHSKRLEEHSRIIEGLSLRIEGLTKAVGELKVAVGSISSRMGLDLEKAVLNVYKDVLLGLGVRDVDKVEKFTYRDYDGKFFSKGARIEVDVYAHDEEAYLIEVKSLLEEGDVDWFDQKCKVASELIGKRVRRRIIVAVNATKESLERAKKLDIDVIYGALVD